MMERMTLPQGVLCIGEPAATIPDGVRTVMNIASIYSGMARGGLKFVTHWVLSCTHMADQLVFCSAELQLAVCRDTVSCLVADAAVPSSYVPRIT